MTRTPEQKARKRETNRAWRHANPEKARAREKARRERDPALYLAQFRARKYPAPTHPCPSACECCGRKPTKMALHLDHDHSTNQFRGWLCNRCNSAIGLLGDNIKGVLQAVDYLNKAGLT